MTILPLRVWGHFADLPPIAYCRVVTGKPAARIVRPVSIGERVGCITIVRRLYATKKKTTYECLCDCGLTARTSSNNFRSRPHDTCGRQCGLRRKLPR